MKKFLLTTVAAATLATFATSAFAEDVTITIESWRAEDLSIWQDQIIPVFEKTNPGIKVKFTPTKSTEYNASLNARLDSGTAGDMITCRPFDNALAQYNKGQLASLNGLDGLKNFDDVAKSAWTTDDGKNIFCVPMASVIHGFIYNKDAFKELGIEVPNTREEFFAALDKIKADGSYTPLAMGTNDQWEAATMGYYNIAPNYHKGEEGRLALLAGDAKLTDAEWTAPFAELTKWKAYLGDNFEAQTYGDSQNLFTLGRAAIYPAGSWEISGFNKNADFEMGAFKPPVAKAGDECYISDHTDIALGMNPASKNPEAVKTFLNWVGSADFATLYANASPGFFSLSNHKVTMEDALAADFVSWRSDCKSSIRSSAQILTRGTPNLDTAIWGASVSALKGNKTPEVLGAELQKGLDSWFKPKM
ncbi:MAG: carbohydrate ABC transporter substrate-binding protein [Rhizobiales bacterium]|nr:carbohydrate ABC transporter substrate-binding protein [Hyphomicrobiales bacterium]